MVHKILLLISPTKLATKQVPSCAQKRGFGDGVAKFAYEQLLRLFFCILKMGNKFLETTPCTSGGLHVPSQTGKVCTDTSRSRKLRCRGWTISGWDQMLPLLPPAGSRGCAGRVQPCFSTAQQFPTVPLSRLLLQPSPRKVGWREKRHTATAWSSGMGKATLRASCRDQALSRLWSELKTTSYLDRK